MGIRSLVCRCAVLYAELQHDTPTYRKCVQISLVWHKINPQTAKILLITRAASAAAEVIELSASRRVLVVIATALYVSSRVSAAIFAWATLIEAPTILAQGEPPNLNNSEFKSSVLSVSFYILYSYRFKSGTLECTYSVTLRLNIYQSWKMSHTKYVTMTTSDLLILWATVWLCVEERHRLMDLWCDCREFPVHTTFCVLCIYVCVFEFVSLNMSIYMYIVAMYIVHISDWAVHNIQSTCPCLFQAFS